MRVARYEGAGTWEENGRKLYRKGKEKMASQGGGNRENRRTFVCNKYFLIEKATRDGHTKWVAVKRDDWKGPH